MVVARAPAMSFSMRLPMEANGMRLAPRAALVAMTIAAMLVPGGCGEPRGEAGVVRGHLEPSTPAPSEFDPVVGTRAVGTLPGDASVTQDGAFLYRIPIEVPPGRAGLQPGLAIRYASSQSREAICREG